MMSIANTMNMEKIFNFDFSTDSCVKIFNLFNNIVGIVQNSLLYPFSFHAIALTLNGFMSKCKFDKIAAISEHLCIETQVRVVFER